MVNIENDEFALKIDVIGRLLYIVAVVVNVKITRGVKEPLGIVNFEPCCRFILAFL